jgi:hypothetical protein
VESSKPGSWREIGPVAGVFVTVSGSTGLLAETSRFGRWAEEGRKETEFGEGGIGARVAVWSKWHAVLGVGADYRGLCLFLLVFEQGLRATDTYNLSLLALQHPFGIVGENGLLVNHRGETDARLLGTF